MQLWRCVELAGEATALAVFPLKQSCNPSITRIGPLQMPLSNLLYPGQFALKITNSEVENRWADGVVPLLCNLTRARPAEFVMFKSPGACIS